MGEDQGLIKLIPGMIRAYTTYRAYIIINQRSLLHMTYRMGKKPKP
jgi:hypothetical protein